MGTALLKIILSWQFNFSGGACSPEMPGLHIINTIVHDLPFLIESIG